MKANKQGSINVPKSGFKRSRFNWSHDVNTTFSWGEIQPTQCKLLVPNSKTTFNAQSLIRLAPMVAPTFGRVKYKTYNQFVSLAEIFPNFDSMMAMEPVSTASSIRIPGSLPYVKLGALSSWVLQGARATIHFAVNTTDGRSAAQNAADGYYITYYRSSPTATSGSGLPSDFSTRMSHLTNGNPNDVIFAGNSLSDAWNRQANLVLPSQNGIILKLGAVNSALGAVFGIRGPIVLGAHQYSDLCPVVRSYQPSSSSSPVVRDYQKEVTFESADYVLEGSVDYDDSGSTATEYFAITFELSDFGKRIRKILQGCGYQIDFSSTANVSILPLIAQYKAYFDIFGLELYQGWETTWCARLIKYIENSFLQDLTNAFLRNNASSLSVIDSSNIGCAFFMQELANEYYTDDVDYVSAHISSLSVGPNADLNGQFITVAGTGSTSLTQTPNIGTNNASSTSQYDTIDTAEGYNPNVGNNTSSLGALHWINKVNHSEIDAELLKRLYKWTNRNTILGRRIAELLRAQGLGKYVDECKSNYIGSTDTLITISDVVSMADTEGASLGEYGGKGLQYTNDKTLVFENDSFGYWVTLATIVPESGYTQGLDTTLTAIGPMDMYRPDFDAVGMEITAKRDIVSTNYIIGSTNYGSQSFGFVPRSSRFKVVGNLVNGDFNRHGKRNTYMPYTLDKQININDYNVTWSAYDDSVPTAVASGTKIDKSLKVEDLPIAGNNWRCPTKYNWLGNFNRIFLNVGEVDDSQPGSDGIMSINAIGINDYNDDNFLCHSIYDVQCYAPMKPIVDSYGLDEDEPDFGSERTSKA